MKPRRCASCNIGPLALDRLFPGGLCYLCWRGWRARQETLRYMWGRWSNYKGGKS